MQEVRIFSDNNNAEFGLENFAKIVLRKEN